MCTSKQTAWCANIKTLLMDMPHLWTLLWLQICQQLAHCPFHLHAIQESPSLDSADHVSSHYISEPVKNKFTLFLFLFLFFLSKGSVLRVIRSKSKNMSDCQLALLYYTNKHSLLTKTYSIHRNAQPVVHLTSSLLEVEVLIYFS